MQNNLCCCSFIPVKIKVILIWIWSPHSTCDCLMSHDCFFHRSKACSECLGKDSAFLPINAMNSICLCVAFSALIFVSVFPFGASTMWTWPNRETNCQLCHNVLYPTEVTRQFVAVLFFYTSVSFHRYMHELNQSVYLYSLYMRLWASCLLQPW